jgi:hypothetical protein
MTRSQTFAYRCRFVLLVLGLGCLAAGVWLLVRHPGVETDALGVGLVGTPLYPLGLAGAHLSPFSAFDIGIDIIFLGLFLLGQWVFLCPRRGWTVRLTAQGRPTWLSLLVAAFLAMLLSVGAMATLLEIPDWWLSVSLARGKQGQIEHDIDLSFLWIVMSLLWILWAGVFAAYWRQGDQYTRLSRIIRGLVAGSFLELLIAAPVHALVFKRGECYCARGSYTGLVFGLTVLLWAFGPGLVLLFMREKYRRAKLLAGLCPRCGESLVEPADNGPSFCPKCVTSELDRSAPRLVVDEPPAPDNIRRTEDRDRTTTQPRSSGSQADVTE